ncbi:hypothetical protein Tco_0401751 [Tanacetum coccineum]
MVMQEIWEPQNRRAEKGYDRFQQLLSQLEAHGAEVSTEDANHKFLRSLPPDRTGLTSEDLKQIDDVDIDEMVINVNSNDCYSNEEVL